MENFVVRGRLEINNHDLGTNADKLLVIDSDGLVKSLASSHLTTNFYTKPEISDILDGTVGITGYNKTNWDTAYAWGDHSLGGYADTNHTHNYLSLAGGTLTGDLIVNTKAYFGSNTTLAQNINLHTDAAITLNPGGSTFGGIIQSPNSGHLLLDLLNNDSGDAIAFRYSSTNNTIINTIGFVMKGDGNVGINTIIPSERLDVNGNIKGTSFIKSGGTSGQFLKADGSVDSNTYLTSTTGNSAYVNKIGDSMSGNLSGGYNDLESWVISATPESNPVWNPSFINELGHLFERGGTVTTISSPTNKVLDSKNLFNGTGAFQNIQATDMPIVFEVVFPQTYTYGLRLGIAFGSGSFRAKDVKIETFTEGAWQTILDVTESSKVSHSTSVSGNSNVGTTKMRITLANPFNPTGYIRVVHIWAGHYASKMGNTLFLGRDGGNMFGDTNWLSSTPKVDGNAVWHAGNLTNVSQLTNDSGYLTSYIDTNTTYTSSNGILLTGTNFAPTYGTGTNTIAQGNDSRINNGQTAFTWGNHAGLYSLTNHTHTFASLTSKPTTVAGYGITDAYTKTESNGNYIQNQESTGQTASMWITGNSKFGGLVTIDSTLKINSQTTLWNSGLSIWQRSSTDDIIFRYYDYGDGLGDKDVMRLLRSGDTIFGGSTTATTFVKSGGTATQFLKADGSVDSNLYLTSSGTINKANKLNVTPNDTFTGIYDLLWHADDVVYSSSWLNVNGATDTVNLVNLIATGNITGSSFIKSGGLSTQFLKADGSVDSNTYTTTSHNHDSNYLKLTGGTLTGGLSFIPTGPGPAVSSVFGANTTYKSYINFNAGAGSNDPGYIMHETSAGASNYGVLHLSPSDDNANGDYVTIHGTNDPETIKLHTSGYIETTGDILGANIKRIGGTSGQFLKADGSVDGKTYIESITPATTPNVATAIVGENIEVSFDASPTSNIDQYLIFSSVDGGSYGLISVIPPADFSPTMSIIDGTFSVSGTIIYRVYSVKNGVYSTPGTSSIVFTSPILEPTNMSVIPGITNFIIQWDDPNSRFISAYNVYKDINIDNLSLSRVNATLIYSGDENRYTHNIAEAELDLYHQFWVETITT